jgi:hypothetical protein
VPITSHSSPDDLTAASSVPWCDDLVMWLLGGNNKQTKTNTLAAIAASSSTLPCPVLVNSCSGACWPVGQDWMDHVMCLESVVITEFSVSKLAWSLLRTFAPYSIRLVFGLSKANEFYMLSALVNLGPVESEGSW